MRCKKEALFLTQLVAAVLFFGACLCLLLHMRLFPRGSMEPTQSLNPLPCHPWPSPSDFFLPHNSKEDAAFDPTKRMFYADHWLSPEVVFFRIPTLSSLRPNQKHAVRTQVCVQVDSFVKQAILLRRPLLERMLNRSSVDTTVLFRFFSFLSSLLWCHLCLTTRHCPDRHFQENGRFLDWLNGDVLKAHVVPGTKTVVLFTVVSISSQARGDFVEFIRNWTWNVEKAMPAGTVPLVVCTAQVSCLFLLLLFFLCAGADQCMAKTPQKL